MDIENAREGLAYIMRELGADRWAESNDGGFTVSAKFVGKRRRRRYFVPLKNVEAAERALKDDLLPSDWVHVKTMRLPDQDR